MNLPKYSSVPLCMILLALAASSYAQTASNDLKPAAVPAVQQGDAESEAKAAAEKAKKEAEAKAAADKAAAEAKAAEEKAAAEKARKEAEAEAKVNSFEGRFPELAKAIAEADLTEDKRAEIDAMSANLMASSDALAESRPATNSMSIRRTNWIA